MFDRQGVRNVLLTVNFAVLKKANVDPKPIFNFLYSRKYLCLSTLQMGTGKLVTDLHPYNMETQDQYLEHVAKVGGVSSIWCMRGVA